MHGNADAFAAVLEQTAGEDFDVTLVLGDLVGYGAAPNQVVEQVRALTGTVHVVRGNHDKVVAGIDSGEYFNQAARAAASWTSEELTLENLRYVLTLPRGPVTIRDGLAICHGSPLDEDAYVFSELDAYEIFSVHSVPVTFFGHTHVPSIFSIHHRQIQVMALRGQGSFTLEPGARYLINPGSIGQPRDRDARAAYMTYDEEERRVRWFRVEYPVETAQRRIMAAGLPSLLAERLEIGV
jgi:predicted phosphodiesterase